jgi:hypothetical protein
VERRLREVEPVGDAVRNHKPTRVCAAELDDSAYAFGRRAPAQVAEANDRTAERECEVIVVPDMDVHAPEDAGP